MIRLLRRSRPWTDAGARARGCSERRQPPPGRPVESRRRAIAPWPPSFCGNTRGATRQTPYGGARPAGPLTHFDPMLETAAATDRSSTSPGGTVGLLVLGFIVDRLRTAAAPIFAPFPLGSTGTRIALALPAADAQIAFGRPPTSPQVSRVRSPWTNRARSRTRSRAPGLNQETSLATAGCAGSSARRWARERARIVMRLSDSGH
jgi:hypothetical protein